MQEGKGQGPPEPWGNQRLGTSGELPDSGGGMHEQKTSWQRRNCGTPKEGGE